MRLRTARDYLRAEDKHSRCLRWHKVPLSPLKGAHAAQRVDAAAALDAAATEVLCVGPRLGG